MSHHQEHPSEKPAAGTGRYEPDETRADGPFVSQVEPDGGTRSGVTDSADGPSWVSDHTAQMPATPGTGPRGDWADPGRMEPTEPDWETRSEPVWAARAQVRTPMPGVGGDDTTHPGWAPVPSEPRRVWWSPIGIGIVVMLLIAALGFGIWLIVQSIGDGEEAAPGVTESVVPSPAPVTTEPSSAPTSAAATTKPPSSLPPEPAEVSVPALVGLSSADARQALDRVGLTYRLIFRSSDAEPGTVIDSDPSEGREVPADTEVTLVIATARSSAPTAGTPTATTTEGAGKPDQ